MCVCTRAHASAYACVYFLKSWVQKEGAAHGRPSSLSRTPSLEHTAEDLCVIHRVQAAEGQLKRNVVGEHIRGDVGVLLRDLKLQENLGQGW